MKAIEISAEQYVMLRKLAAAGCCLDWQVVPQPRYPLYVEHRPAALGTEVLPLAGDCTALIFRVRITAAVPFLIGGLGFQADWPPAGPQYLTYDDRVECCGGQIRLQGSLLNRIISRGVILKRNQSLSGYIALSFRQKIAPSAEKLEAILLINDRFGRSYPYSFAFVNTQQITGAGDSECCFLSAEQVQEERAQREAARAKHKLMMQPFRGGKDGIVGL